MQPSDLSKYVELASPELSPDEHSTVFVVSRMNFEEDRYDESIWLHDNMGERQFTAGPGDSAPVWSPDGSKVAFLRLVDKAAQIAVMPLTGGEATVITDSELGFASVKWFASGEQLLGSEKVWAEGWGDHDDDERDRMPRRITEIPYRFDNLGWVHQRRSQLVMVQADGTEPTVLTAPLFGLSNPQIMPSQDRVVFLADDTERTVRNMDRAVYQVTLGSTQATQVTDLGGWSVLALDGNELIAGGYGTATWPLSQCAFRLKDDEWSRMAPDLDRTVTAIAPQMTKRGLAVALEDAGRVDLAFITDEGHDVVATSESVITGFSASASGEKVVFVASEMTNPGELYSLQGEEVIQLTSMNTGVDVEFVEGTRISVPGDGGDIDAWVYLPEGDGRVPVLLNVHGGPAAQYGAGFFDEFQMYVAAGYGVIACNPRGSAGRGTPWMQAVTGDGWGVNDLADIQTVVAGALDQFDRLDDDRMGVMGGSYGGFMTGWLIAKEDRWKSAVVERALLSYPSFYGTSDIGTYFTPNYVTGAMPEDAGELWQKSPLAYTKDMTTPTLIVHSENDWRCPIEQAEQLFAHLLMNGVETEMIRFPGEGHEMSRGGGKPKHRKERAEAILEWHSRYLG
jgi:dipeptidyl aminopeptidase/acylaminoacyl peptidase